ncbi:MAG TPA: radical SAM protein, partial [Acidimicrobiales bacterium]|nr:radical SAM protein [Acidimicrobiales bacterium]
MRALLLSTYELGHQPLHVASPAAALLAAGHDVRCVDLSVEPLGDDALDWADAVALSVPMHTAMRLARALCARIRSTHPGLPICFYGLYAVLEDEDDDDTAGDRGAQHPDRAIAGEYEPALVDWFASSLGAGPDRPSRAGVVSVHLGRHPSGLPARHLLPPLQRYARLVLGSETRLAGAVEASHGCAHRCRHCPVPVVYDGRTRVVGVDAVVADVAQLVGSGARHITFADADFLNGPHHSRRVVAAVHGAFPDLTFDVTVKVEHILAWPDLWPEFASAGCLFVVSAFESATDSVLERLDKGHRVTDELEAVRVLRGAGIEPRPSLLPFTPWTSATDVLDLLDLVACGDLAGNVDPVQYSIRLLVPPGSLLLRHGQLHGRLDAYDTERLGWSWRARDPRVDELQQRLARLAEERADGAWDPEDCYRSVRETAVEVLDAHERAAAPAVLPDLRSPVAPELRP